MAKFKKIKTPEVCHLCGHFRRPLVLVDYSDAKPIRVCGDCLTAMTKALLDGETIETPPAPEIVAIVNNEPMYKK